MSRPTVSVIIPVYNAEKYLETCINSVLEQDYPDLDIILVDDGSLDHCPDICDRYARKYPNIQVIHQTNRGAGPSREAGAARAGGKYLMFADSDDCLDGTGAVRSLVTRAEETHADIVTGAYRRIQDAKSSGINRHHLQECDAAHGVDFRFKGFFMYGHLAYNWGKLYRRSFLEQHAVHWPAYSYMQDKAHNMACCACSPVYAFIEESVYQYRSNKSSVTFRYKKDLMELWLSVAEGFQTFLRERKISGAYEDLIAFHIFFGIFYLVKQELWFQKHGFLASVKTLRAYAKNPLVKKSIRSLAKGSYVKQIEPLSWKIVIRGVSVMYTLGAYGTLTAAIALLRMLRVDSHITRTRYRDEEK